MSEQRYRYKAIHAVAADGRTVSEVARNYEVARQTVHVRLGRMEPAVDSLTARSAAK